jgi:hypothetical protein
MEKMRAFVTWLACNSTLLLLETTRTDDSILSLSDLLGVDKVSSLETDQGKLWKIGNWHLAKSVGEYECVRKGMVFVMNSVCVKHSADELQIVFEL